MGDGQFLSDHAAHRMTDQMHAVPAPRIEQCQQGSGQTRKCHSSFQNTVTVTRHIPRGGAEIGGKIVDLRTPTLGATADTVQKQDDIAVSGDDTIGYCAHARSPCSVPPSTTTVPFSAMVQLRSGMSKWPSV